MINSVVKNYGDFRALHGIDLTIQEGEFIALVGPSGSGKSTLLQIISGFEGATGGNLRIDGRDMTNVAPADRPTSMVFQKLALFPHKTVADNIGFPLKIAKVDKAEIQRRTLEMIHLMELKPEYLTRYPAQLSGGEQQRVALARSMISNPKLLLLDEPLSALDVKLKKVLQAELKRLHQQLGVTFVHVTHDLEEAMMLADTICVMRNGRLLQVGPPDDIYYRPKHKFVAEFIGATNLFPVTLESGPDGTATYAVDGLAGVVGTSSFAPSEQAATPATGYLMIRPEFMSFEKDASRLDAVLTITVETIFNHGSITQVKGRVEGSDYVVTLEIQGHLDRSIIQGALMRVGWRDTETHLLAREEDGAS